MMIGEPHNKSYLCVRKSARNARSRILYLFTKLGLNYNCVLIVLGWAKIMSNNALKLEDLY